jgi:hypothetical protein
MSTRTPLLETAREGEEYFLRFNVFDGDFGDGMEHHTCSMVTSRKDHLCHACRKPIKKGERCRVDKWIEDGEGRQTARHCVECLKTELGHAGVLDSENAGRVAHADEKQSNDTKAP